MDLLCAFHIDIEAGHIHGPGCYRAIIHGCQLATVIARLGHDDVSLSGFVVILLTCSGEQDADGHDTSDNSSCEAQLHSARFVLNRAPDRPVSRIEVGACYLIAENIG
jgi:hypothetical protein